MDNADHFGQQAEFLWYYSAFGIVHGDVFKTDAAVGSLKEGRSRRVSFLTHVTKYCGILLCCHHVVSLDVHSVCSHTSTGLCTGTLQPFAVLKEKSNKMQQRIKILLFHIYLKLNMFRATHRPLSGA
jgi:hypothetical protein